MRWSNGFLRSLDVRLVRPSVLDAWRIALGLTAAAALWHSAPDAGPAAALRIALLAGLPAGLWLGWRRSRHRIVQRAWLEPDGRWRLRLADGRQLGATLQDCWMAGPLIGLRWLAGGARRHGLVHTGSLSPATRRRLRVRLRLQGLLEFA